MLGEAKILSPATNRAVVQLPERHYPGVVFQGDTLFHMVSLLAEMQRDLRAGDYSELAFVIEELQRKLGGALSHYEDVCKQHGIDLPYPKGT